MSPTRARRAEKTLAAEIIVQSPRWKALPRVQSTVRKALDQAAAAVPTAGGELAIVLADDSTLRALNRDWRGIDKPTNVLSFPAKELRSAGHKPIRAPAMLGDIVIAYQTTAREAKEQGKPLAHHLAHLTVHGYLHLAGYDHESDADAQEMESLETAILARLDIPDPYLVRDACR